MRRRDVPAVAAIERDSFRSPWPRQAFLDELRNNSTIARLRVARAEDGGPVLGYICSWVVGEELMINNVAVAADHRGRGLGRALVVSALGEGVSEGCRVAWLEVRPSNAAAVHLYETLGFSTVARRRRYYTDTQEDALVMRAFLERP
ncbi:MAG: ribosomal protein S18-alanine N-acetyltransferase [Candidatus Polarisedimenticolia bacterium]